jgi:hypothetical protein
VELQAVRKTAGDLADPDQLAGASTAADSGQGDVAAVNPTNGT